MAKKIFISLVFRYLLGIDLFFIYCFLVYSYEQKNKYKNYLNDFSCWLSTKISRSDSISSKTIPVPRTTAVNGSSIMRTGISD